MTRMYAFQVSGMMNEPNMGTVIVMPGRQVVRNGVERTIAPALETVLSEYRRFLLEQDVRENPHRSLAEIKIEVDRAGLSSIWQVGDDVVVLNDTKPARKRTAKKAAKKRVLSPETRQKISDGIKRAHALKQRLIEKPVVLPPAV